MFFIRPIFAAAFFIRSFFAAAFGFTATFGAFLIGFFGPSATF